MRCRNVLYVAIKIQASVEHYTEQSHCVAGLHAEASAADSAEVSAKRVPQIIAADLSAFS
jgi:hypothetical protein